MRTLFRFCAYVLQVNLLPTPKVMFDLADAATIKVGPIDTLVRLRNTNCPYTGSDLLASAFPEAC